MKKLLKFPVSFFIIVLLPTMLSAIYFLFIATPTYVCESKLVIKTLGVQEGTSGLHFLLQSIGLLAPSSSGGYLLMNYIHSRDAMFELDKEFKLKEYYSSKRWDFLRRFDPFRIDPSYENFYLYYKDFVVNLSMDPHSSIVIVKTRSLDPDYCYELSKGIIKMSERFINEMNRRSSLTALRYFKEQLEESRRKVKDFSKKIIRFINKTKVVSPEQQIAILLQTTAKLQEQLILKQLELSQLLSVAPQNPQIDNLRREIKEIRKEIKRNIKKIAGTKSSVGPLSVELELMKAEMQMLYKEVEANLTAYLQAQNQAFLQHLFIETVEKPVKPDSPTEPKTGRDIFVVFAISLALWGVISLFFAGVKEHMGE